MSNIELIKSIRNRTGLPLKDINKAIEAIGTNEDEVIKHLREQGVLKTQARQDRETSQGGVFVYSHEGRIGVMVEIKCETDFVSRADAFQELGKDLALHIAAYQPKFVSPEDVDAAFIEGELEIARKLLEAEGKNPEMIEKILGGKKDKISKENSLLSQPFLKNPDSTVANHLASVSQTTGEKIAISRFVIYSLNS